MKLYDPKLECLAIKGLTDPKLRDDFMSLLSEDSFHEEFAKQAYNKILKMIRAHGTFPSWEVLTSDLSIPEEHRKIMVALATGATPTAQIIDQLDTYRRSRMMYTAYEMLDGAIRGSSMVLEETVGNAISMLQKAGTSPELSMQREDDEDERVISMLADLRDGKSHRLIRTGIKKFDTVNGGVPRGTHFIIAGPTGEGKCVAKGTLVGTQRGLRRIDDLIDRQGMDLYHGPVSLVNCYGELEKPTHTFSRVCNTLKITTRMGYSLPGTPNHPVQTLDKYGNVVWRNMEALEVGDAILVRRGGVFANTPVSISYTHTIGGMCSQDTHSSYSVFDSHSGVDIKCTSPFKLNVPNTLDAEFAEFLGLYLSEGSVSGNRFRFTNLDRKILAKVTDFLDKIGQPYKVINQNSTPCVVGLRSGSLVRVLEALGIPYERHCGTLSVPWSILASPKPIVAAFIRAYMEGDGGWVNDDAASKIEAVSASKTLAAELQVLLLQFGIISRVKEVKRKLQNTSATYYKLLISGTDVDLYMQDIGFLSKRKSAHANVIRNTNVDVIPDEIRSRVLTQRQKHSGYKAGVYTGANGRQRIQFGTFRSMPYLREWLATQSTKFAGLDTASRTLVNDLSYLSEFFIDRVKRIKAEEPTRVYDFTLPETHSFMTNGIVSHNSALAEGLGLNMSVYGKPGGKGVRVCFVSLEMPEDMVWIRACACLSGIHIGDILNSRLSQDKWNTIFNTYRLAKHLMHKAGGDFRVYVPTRSLTIEQLLAVLKPYAYDVIIIDYLSLLSGFSDADFWHKLGDAANLCQSYAVSTGTVVVSLAQADEDGQVRLSKMLKDNAGLMWTWESKNKKKDEKDNTGKPKAHTANTIDSFDINMPKARMLTPFTLRLYRALAVMQISDDAGDLMKETIKSWPGARSLARYLSSPPNLFKQKLRLANRREAVLRQLKLMRLNRRLS